MDIEGKIVEKMMSICYNGNDRNELEIIEYGLQLIVECVFKLFILAVLALCIGKFKEYVEFLIIFCPIHSNAGGIHCKTNFGCTFIMFLTFVGGTLLNSIQLSSWLCAVLFVICMTVCMKWAPSSTKDNPIIDMKVRKRKRYLCISMLVFWYIELVVSFLNVHYGYIIVTYISIAITILLQERRRLYERECKENNM